MSAKRLIQAYLAVALMTLLTGCGQIGYYTQSVVGHSELMLARRSLDKSIDTAEEQGNAELVAYLQVAARMREFAVNELALPDNGSYRNYVALDRRFPVWTVVATPEFSVEAYQWCYLIIGCASYRGYFDLQRARRYAEELQAQGFETAVGGAVAYSTLGWFRDPLLPSMFEQGEAQLAEILFHELAHQVLYVKGDSDFNEAFATVVGETGAQRWLQQNSPELLLDYQQRQQAYRQFVTLLLDTRMELQQLYATKSLNDDAMRAEKRAVFEQLRKSYATLKHDHWSGNGWFDRWFERPLNNARLSAVATYYQQVPQLTALLQRCGSDFDRFYRVLKEAAKADELDVPTDC